MTKNRNMAIITGISISVLAISLVGFADSYAHKTVYDGDIKVVIGHSDEPSFGHKKGMWLGMHNVNAIVSQNNVPIGDANLQVDKYFFNNVKRFDRADSLDDANKKSLGNPLPKKFGTDNLYNHDQIVKAGIYVYRVYGEANGEPVDVTVSCHDDKMKDPSKFDNFDSGSKKFSCPQKIDSIKFP